MSDSVLPTIWFVLWGLLWAIYFALDGFDLGAGMLAGLLRSDREQHALVRSLGPVWDGNEVWLITAGGVTFAAFPRLYAVMFSSLYIPLMAVLLGLVLRVVAIEFFHLDHSPAWQRTWARILSGGSLVVALLLGVAFGNIFQGLPLDGSGYHGTLLGLLNPYGLLTGALFVLAFLFNGSAWLASRAPDDDLRQAAFTLARRTWPWFFVAGGAFLGLAPLATGLAGNYLRHPALAVLPLAAVTCLAAARLALGRGRAGPALVAGSLAVLTAVLSGVVGLYPQMLPSSIDPAAGLTAFSAASSPYTLRAMLIVTVIFLPLVLVYQAWFYKVFATAPAEEEARY